MIRHWLAAAVAVLALTSHVAAGQPRLSTLRVSVSISARGSTARPVPRFALLVSDNPTSAPPRRTVTDAAGRAELHLPPGTYTVESEQALVFEGASYEWSQTVSVGTEGATLELNAANASVGLSHESTTDLDVPALVMRWQDSVVTVWGEAAHGSGFLVDANGLILTTRRVTGDSSSAEVQLSPATKVAARVVASDAHVAVLRVNPLAVQSLTPMTLADARPAEGDPVVTIGTPLLRDKQTTAGVIRSGDAETIETDLVIDRDSAGGPLLTRAGSVVGLTDDEDGSAIPIDRALSVLASARAALQRTAPPGAAHLPVEPERRPSNDALTAIVRTRAGTLTAPTLSVGDFDLRFITPISVYGAQYYADLANARAHRSGGASDFSQPLEDFGNWEAYVAEVLPVLLVRITPKVGEGFWQAVGRSAAQTQGISLPPMKHPKAAFGGFSLFCGDSPVPPVHPFRIVHRMTDRNGDPNGDRIDEGLYVFTSDAISPRCGTVKVVVSRDRGAPDAQVVDPAIIEHVWGDFEVYRTAGAPH